MPTNTTADLIERLRKRQLELREEQWRVNEALFALTGRRPTGRPRKRPPAMTRREQLRQLKD